VKTRCFPRNPHESVLGFIDMRVPTRESVLLYLVGAAVVLTVISITAFEILMGLALLGLLGARARLRLPSFSVPLALFIMGTLGSGGIRTTPRRHPSSPKTLRLSDAHPSA
jgi:hypothetical protein